MTIKLAVPETQLSGLVLNSAKMVTAVAVFLVLMGTVMNSMSRTRAASASLSPNEAVDSGRGTVLPAKLAATAHSTILSDLAARVASVEVAPGDRVEAGQIIAKLESADVTLGAQIAEKRYERAQERLAMLEKSGQNGILREEYMSAVRRADAARQKVQDFRLDEREQSYTRAKQSAAEMQKLVEQRLATGAEAEQSARDAENQSHSLEAARQQWQQLKRDAEDADAQLRIIKMRTEQGADAELLAVRKELEEAKIAYELAAGRLTGLQVVAARKGTVLAVNIAPGDRVLLGTPLFRLSDLSTLDVQVSVSAKVAREIKAGTSVKVRLPTEPPQEMKAQVNSVLLVPDAESQGYQVKITIPNPDPDVILAGLDCAVVFPYITGGESWIKRLF